MNKSNIKMVIETLESELSFDEKAFFMSKTQEMQSYYRGRQEALALAIKLIKLLKKGE